MTSAPILALSLSHSLTEIGAIAAFAALVGIALLALLFFAQARELKRLREWAGSAPERFAEIERRLAADAAAAQAQRYMQTTGTRIVPRMTPVVSRAATAATVAGRPPVPPGAAQPAPGQPAPTGPAPGQAGALAAAPLGEGAPPPIPAPTGQLAPAAPDSSTPEAPPGEAPPTEAAHPQAGEQSANGAAPAPAQAAAPGESGSAETAAPNGRRPGDESSAQPAQGDDGAENADDGAENPDDGAEEADSPVQPDSGAEEADSRAERSANGAEQGAPAPATVAARSSSRVSAAFPGAPAVAAPTGVPSAGSSAAMSPSAPAPATPAGSKPATVGAAAPAVPGQPVAGGSRMPPTPPAGRQSDPRASGAEQMSYKHLREEEPRSSRGLLAGVGAGVIGLVIAAVVVVLIVGHGGSKKPSGAAHPPRHHRVAHVARVSPAHTSVTVLNSTDVNGLAGHTSGKLRDAGYARTKASFGEPNGNYPDTVVQYSPGKEPEARGVAKAIGVHDVGRMTSAVRGLVHGADVAVVVGQNQAEAAAAEGAGEGEAPAGEGETAAAGAEAGEG